MLDRLTPQDATNLRTEDRGSAMHVAGLAMLAGEPLLDAHGDLRLADIRTHVERRLHLMPRLRQVLHRPPAGLGSPVWVDARSFDIRRHVRTDPVPEPGDEAALLAKVAELNEPPLARSRPLWELRFLTGLANGRVGLLIRLHHVVADGVAALALIGPLFDAAPDTPPPIPPDLDPRTGPAERPAAHRFAPPARRALRRRGVVAPRPERWWEQSTSTVGPMLQMLRDGPAPRSVLNGPIGARRRLALVRADLERTRAAAHAHGAKVNDVVLAAVAGGARDLLEHHEGRPPRAALRAMVPVSRRATSERRRGRQPRRDHRRAAAGRRSPTRFAGSSRSPASRPSGSAGRSRHGRASRRSWPRRCITSASSTCSRATSPARSSPWYFAGARVLEFFQIGPVQGNVRLNVGALSYAGGLYLDAVADADALSRTSTCSPRGSGGASTRSARRQAS